MAHYKFFYYCVGLQNNLFVAPKSLYQCWIISMLGWNCFVYFKHKHLVHVVTCQLKEYTNWFPTKISIPTHNMLRDSFFFHCLSTCIFISWMHYLLLLPIGKSGVLLGVSVCLCSISLWLIENLFACAICQLTLWPMCLLHKHSVCSKQAGPSTLKLLHNDRDT
jgi:hypothetical protein